MPSSLLLKISVLSLLNLASSLPTTIFHDNTRTCQEYIIPITTTTVEAIPAFQPFRDNFDVVDFVNQIAARDAAKSFAPFSGTRNATHSYDISGTICWPTVQTEQAKTILLATPGLGFDKRYWDIQMNAEEYSFVDYAISRGYSVFFYDRLGTGLSSKVSGYDGAQASTHLAILKQLSVLLRSGQYTGGVGKPSKLAHVGHSFGSFLSQGLITQNPELSDGALFTGLAWDSSSQPPALESMGLRIANTQSEGRWVGLDNQYLTSGDIAGNAAFFFHGDSYDKQMLWYSDSVAQPLAIIELLTLTTLITGPSKFHGPVMVISGEFDFPLCGGNCTDTLRGPAELFFSNATDLQTVVHPKTGHAINYSFNATGAYAVMLDYLHKHQV
ncbi:alpha/beta-Hydrolase [Glarea lozoyensis ATCC 20868]|uniref:Alpha/beta-Hydrolase n=1 Tax=Glarea lozoyensis (strain ATCC 20868 / MF5171) TaxID=1116229 RepID=S3D726_GLAL2|nr:alpha/beta-Hydrolase [Glarea lozoyensis ATCC 20868]EPE27791.1 alpha/beta-Hydrolase [Glarea lozoyensis ATCC 20868]